MTIIISKSTSKREPQVAAFKLGQGFMMRLRYFGNAKKIFHLNIKGKSNYTCKDVTSKHDHELYVLVMVSSTDECMKIIFNLRSFHRIFVFKSNPLMNNTDYLIGKMFQVSF